MVVRWPSRLPRKRPRHPIPRRGYRPMMRTAGLSIERVIDTTPVSVVVLSALNVEFGAVRAHLTRPRIIRHHAGTIFETGQVGASHRRIAAAVTGEGNHSAAIIAER